MEGESINLGDLEGARRVHRLGSLAIVPDLGTGSARVHPVLRDVQASRYQRQIVMAKMHIPIAVGRDERAQWG